jgi:tRNA(fMet)-specific endonuclease VapC
MVSQSRRAELRAVSASASTAYSETKGFLVDYLLDTNACIALINSHPEAVRSRLQKAMNSEALVFVSSVAVYELWYGVSKSSRQDFNRKRLETFLTGPLTVLPIDDEDARAAGMIRAALEIAGKPIDAYDTLMAGQAIRHQLTLVTTNVAEFSRVKGLAWENWASS